MMKHIRGSMPAILLSTAIVAGVSGCGAGHDGIGGTDGDALSMLEPGIQALDNRLQSHYTAVTDVLNSADERSAVTQGTRSGADAAVQDLGLMDEDWQAIRMETEDYGQDMHRILNDLGERVTMIGACQMTMGGMMFGSPNGGNTCPCEPYMDTSTEELEQHLDEMLRWMDREDLSRLWEEMDSHRGVMRSDIEDMGSHMRQAYGAHGGMMGMM